MPVAFNHTIVHSRDVDESATFFSQMMGLPAPKPFGPFLAVPVEHGATFDFAQAGDDEEIHPQHYAFLVTEDDFDAIYGRILEHGIEHYPEPHSAGSTRSTTTTAVAGCTGATRAATSSRSSPSRTAGGPRAPTAARDRPSCWR